MVEAVDVDTSAHRLTGDLRALALVYSSSTRLKPPSSLLPALETLLSRTRTITMKENHTSPELETPSKRRKLCGNSESADRDLCAPIKNIDAENNISETEMDKADTVNDTMSSDSGDDKAAATARHKSSNVQAEAIATSINDAVSPPSLVTTANSCTNQLRCSLTNVSWLEMLEKTIADLQTIVQVQSKNN
ncbi:hypothetical protein P5V15_000494 [Pogonomyrmex californicus]